MQPNNARVWGLRVKPCPTPGSLVAWGAFQPRMKITAQNLVNAGVPADARIIGEVGHNWPDGMDVNRKNLDWLIEAFLPVGCLPRCFSAKEKREFLDRTWEVNNKYWDIYMDSWREAQKHAASVILDLVGPDHNEQE